jgi:trans-aconitate 2-methyltransferase
MRAARDLLVHVPLASADFVCDLGCGPGYSAYLLSQRFPTAEIIGLDTPEAMLARARSGAVRARFVKQDIADWAPDERPDVNFANAAMQFLPDHDVLFLASPRIS